MRTRCAPERVFKVIENLNENQRKAVEEIGFGGILSIKCTHLRRELCQWLVQNFNPYSCTLDVYGKSFKVTHIDVMQIMGLHGGGCDVPTVGNQEDIIELTKQYCNTKGEIPLTMLENQLKEDKTAGDGFKVRFALHVLGALLCPTQQLCAKRSFLYALREVNSLRNMNWAKMVFDYMVEGVKHFKEKDQKGINCCIFFLMVIHMLEH